MNQIESLISTLSNLQLGEKCWYWLCQDSTEQPLLLLPFNSAGGLRSLVAKSKQVPLPKGARVRTGIASVSSSGTLQFGGQNLDKSMLKDLADWVRSHLEAHPALAALSGSELVEIGALGTVNEIFAHPEGWVGITRPPFPGQLEHAAAVFSALAVGEQALVWMEEDSTSVIAVRFDHVNAQTLFSERVNGARVHKSLQASGIKGLLLRTPSGELLFTTRSDILGVGSSLQDWLSEAGGMRLVQVNSEGPPSVTVIAANNTSAVGLERIASAIDAILDDAVFNFFFTPADVNGKAHLFLEPNSNALKQAATQLGRPSVFVRGQVKLVKGIILFRTKQNHTTFLKELADWAVENVEHCPQIRRLAGSRMVVRDSDGNTINRVKNDTIWNTLRNERTQV